MSHHPFANGFNFVNQNQKHCPHTTIGIIVLGCDKNTADAERMAGMLSARLPESANIQGITEDTGDVSSLDAVVIYTCAFIHDAKEESIETILEWCRRKADSGSPRRVYVVGCLSERYAAELREEIPEVDGFFGVHEIKDILNAICGDTVIRKNKADLPTRKQLDSKPYAFLKIADGCNHACTFCIIPAIKGEYLSRSREILLAEAQELITSGIREINLVAQDTTAYGRDLYPDYRLPDLLRDLCAIPGDFWIRCLYCYPSGINDALIEQLATQPKIVPYLDIPLQHVSPPILKAMLRPAPEQDIPALITHLRHAIPGLAVRTTMMVGFPGETEEDHKIMLDTIQEIGFQWLGAFTFCPEEGTVAATMTNGVPEEIAQERYEALMELQAEITAGFNASREGQRVRVLVEAYDDDLNAWTARSAAEAPEVDGAVLIHPHPAIRPGEFIEVELLEASLYDITAKVTQ